MSSFLKTNHQIFQSTKFYNYNRSCVLIFLCLVFIFGQYYVFHTYYCSNGQPANWNWKYSLLFQNSSSSSHHSGSSNVLNITNFSFILNPINTCNLNNLSSNNSKKKFLLIIIPSSRINFESRAFIRQTWGSIPNYNHWHISKVFLLGLGNPKLKNSTTIQAQIEQESEIYSDIVLGSFIDSYRDLSYKHLMSYKWISEYCSNVDFILKADDDVMIDIFEVVNYINLIVHNNKTIDKYYYCSKNHGVGPMRDKGSKWEVSVQEYPSNLYPPYCGFAAYLTTFNVIQKILSVTTSLTTNKDKGLKYFWIDDVFVTGIIRQEANNIEIINIYEKYGWSWELSKDEHDQFQWNSSLSFVIVPPQYQNVLMNRFWKQILKLHGIKS